MKKAFTLLELIFVIVVVGILAAVIIPNTRTNPLQEAAVQLVSHIRYTQHLAMMDDKFDANDPIWFKKRWQILFSQSAGANYQLAYTIFTDISGSSTGEPNESEVAIDPESRERILTGGYNTSEIAMNVNHSNFAGLKKLNLGMTYGISDFKITGGSTNSNANAILFDYLGRIYRGSSNTLNSSYHRLAKSPIYIKLCSDTCSEPKIKANNANEIVIKIEPETGYAHIL